MSGPRTPGGGYGSVPSVGDGHVSRGYGNNSGAGDFAQGNPSAQVSSPLSQSLQNNTGALRDNYSQQGSSIAGDEHGLAMGLDRPGSSASTAVQAQTPSRNNTLKKKNSVKRTSSLKRSGSKRSLKAAGSIKGVQNIDDKDFNSAFYTPVPTTGSPTEILANRFQAWRQLLKSLITYFRDVQTFYDARLKAMHKVQNTITNISPPGLFVTDNGLSEAINMIQDYHKRSIAEAGKSREIENDVVSALTGLRSDLSQKIKEIKSLSGDFKNSVDKEREATQKEVDKLREALHHADHDDGTAVGRNDPYIVRLGVDRMVEKQIDEENYLHRAYLNLESSGRELESIVVGEIQKAYNALAGILKREGDDAYNVVENLRTGPIAMPKDHEWISFVENDPHFVDPRTPLRRIEDITYPGKSHPAATEVRSGMLERKSKYLKSYTPGWYVLSPTHLHEFKSADKIYTQPPVMSLYLLDQKLGSHSQPGSSSNKFMLKGRQTGSMHKGHSWVFRAESYETMLAWFEDIRILTEKSGPERDAFIRKHARSISGSSARERARSVSSDGLEDDEADQAPFTVDASSLAGQHPVATKPQRPAPGGRFPSDLNVERSRVPKSPSSESEDTDIIAAAALPGSHQFHYDGSEDPYRLAGVRSEYGTDTDRTNSVFTPHESYAGASRAQPQTASPAVEQPATPQPSSVQQRSLGNQPVEQPSTKPEDWAAPVAAGVAGVGAGALGTVAAQKHQEKEIPEEGYTPEQKAAFAPQPIAPPTTTATATVEQQQTAVPAVTKQDSAPTVAAPTADGIGGLEAEGAKETGRFFPAVVRHNTDMSVSALHVPGQYPKQGAGK